MSKETKREIKGNENQKIERRVKERRKKERKREKR